MFTPLRCLSVWKIFVVSETMSLITVSSMFFKVVQRLPVCFKAETISDHAAPTATVYGIWNFGCSFSV